MFSSCSLQYRYQPRSKQFVTAWDGQCQDRCRQCQRGSRCRLLRRRTAPPTPALALPRPHIESLAVRVACSSSLLAVLAGFHPVLFHPHSRPPRLRLFSAAAQPSASVPFIDISDRNYRSVTRLGLPIHRSSHARTTHPPTTRQAADPTAAIHHPRKFTASHPSLDQRNHTTARLRHCSRPLFFCARAEISVGGSPTSYPPYRRLPAQRRPTHTTRATPPPNKPARAALKSAIARFTLEGASAPARVLVGPSPDYGSGIVAACKRSQARQGLRAQEQ